MSGVTIITMHTSNNSLYDLKVNVGKEPFPEGNWMQSSVGYMSFNCMDVNRPLHLVSRAENKPQLLEQMWPQRHKNPTLFKVL